jgi:hypothetical protein
MYSQHLPCLVLRRLTLHIFACAAVIVMCHFQPRSLVSALDIESLVRLAAVENALVTSNLLRDEIQSLDQLEAELLSLLVFGDCNIFNVTDETQVVDAMRRYG